MLAADADLEIWLRLPAALDRHPHHRPDTVAIEHLERVRGDDLLLDVARQEALLGIITRYAEDSLRQVVRAEREELRLRRDLVGDDAGARDLDHRAELEIDLGAAFLLHRLGDRHDLFVEAVELSHRADQRHHDLRLRLDPPLLGVDRGAEDRADLHLEDLGIDQEQSAAT